MKSKLIITGILALSMHMAQAQTNAKPEDTEVWEPVPSKVTPGNLNFATPPSDAIILFDGKNLSGF
jgi:hypothetical protein